MAQNVSESADSLLEAGLRALDAGDYSQALESWNLVLEADPGNSRAADLVEQLSELIRDNEVGQLTPMSGEFVIVVDEQLDAASSTPLPGTTGQAPQTIARGALERLQRLLDTHEERNVELNNQIATLDADLLNAREELQTSERSLLSARERSLHLEKDTTGFAAKRRDQERVANQRARQLAELEHLVEELRAQSKQAEAEIGALKQRITSTEANLQLAASEAASATGKLDDASQAQDAALFEVEQLRDELIELRHALASEQASVEELREGHGTLSKELVASAAQANAADESARENATKLQAERDKAINDLERAGAELIASKSDLDTARTERRSLQQRLDAGTTALAASHATAVKLESALDALTVKTTTETSDLRAELATNAEEKVVLSRLVDELERAQPAGAELSAALDEAIRRAEAAEELAAMHDDRANAGETRVHELSQEIAQLSRRLSEVDDGEAQFTTGSHRVASKRSTQHTPLESRAVTNSYDSVEEAVAEAEAFADANGEDVAATSSGIPDDTQPGFDDEISELDSVVGPSEKASPGPVVGSGTLIGHVGDDLFGVELGIRSATPAGGVDDQISELTRYNTTSTGSDDLDQDTDSGTHTSAGLRISVDDDLVIDDDAELVDFEVTGGHASAEAIEFSITSDETVAEEEVSFHVTNTEPVGGEDVESAITENEAALDEEEEIMFDLEDDINVEMEVSEEDIGESVEASDDVDEDVDFDLHDDEFSDTEGALSAIAGDTDAVSQRLRDTQPSGAHALHLLDESLTPHERLSWVIDETPRRMEADFGPGQEIDSQAAFVLQLIDGTVTFADVIDIVGLPQEDTSRILVDLLRRRIISTPSATL